MMTWFVVGVGIGGAFGFLFAWLLQEQNVELDGRTVCRLLEENAELRKQAAILRAQLEAMDEFSALERS